MQSIPKEVWHLVDALFAHHMQAGGSIFVDPVAPAELERLRECVDVGEPFDNKFTPQAVAQTLVELLGSLCDPVVPVHLFPYAALDVDGAHMPVWSRRFLDQVGWRRGCRRHS